MITNWTNELSELSDEIYNLMERVAANANFEVTAQDSRLVALSGMQQTVLSCGFWLSTYHNIAEGHQNNSMVLKYAGSNLSLEDTEKIMLDQIRLGLVVFFHFKLENLFGGLLNKIASKKLNNIGETFKELSKEAGLSDAPQYAEIIKAFSSIRNSLHNNGIHSKESFSVPVGKFNYKFSKDGVVQCASLGHCITLIQAIMNIIESILVSEKIKKITAIIPDTYAEWLDKKEV